MAELTLNTTALQHNHIQLQSLLNPAGIGWGLVSKLLCGHPDFLQEVLALNPQQVMDSRLSNLHALRGLNAELELGYIKPIPPAWAEELVSVADFSLQSETATLKALSEAAVAQHKTHRIWLMLELGDRREGLSAEALPQQAELVQQLPGLELEALGANVHCMNGVLPNYDKLMQLQLLAEIVELRTGAAPKILSGGSTVTLPLVYREQIPRRINHLRLGEALFFGADLFQAGLLPSFRNDVFELNAQLVELSRKPVLPDGQLVANPFGEQAELDESLYGCQRWQGLLDLGALDVDPKTLESLQPDVEIVGATSDLLAVDLGACQARWQVGDTLRFRPNYMGVLHLMQSDYIDKRVLESDAQHPPKPEHPDRNQPGRPQEGAFTALPGQNPAIKPVEQQPAILPGVMPLN